MAHRPPGRQTGCVASTTASAARHHRHIVGAGAEFDYSAGAYAAERPNQNWAMP
jgi:hypothetical protein